MKRKNGWMIPEKCQDETLLTLAKKHKHPRDDDIFFTEHDVGDGPHKYYVQDSKVFTSVTTVIHGFFEEFDGESVANGIIRRRDFLTNPKYAQYAQFIYDDLDVDGNPRTDVIWKCTNQVKLETFMKSQLTKKLITDKIIQSWKKNGEEQSRLGSIMHNQIELFNNDGTLPETPSKEFNLFLEYDKEVKTEREWIPFRTEMRVWDMDHFICGSIDMIYVAPQQDIWAWVAMVQKSYFEFLPNVLDGKICECILDYLLPLQVHLVDWKRSKAITEESYGKYGKYPCDKTPDANKFHYILQLNFYKYFVEKLYHMQVLSMSNIICHPNNDCYLEYTIRNEQHLVKAMIEEFNKNRIKQ